MNATKDKPARWGAYWLHPDGWYRLFPPGQSGTSIPKGADRVQTHYCKGACSEWIAVDMDMARKKLVGYDLTDEEQKDIVELMAGYCQLLDESGLIGYDDTKTLAIADLKLKGEP
jgi:hypothetical protein